MQLSDISVWGVIVLLVLTGMAASLFMLVDRRTGPRLLRAAMVGTLQLVVLGGVTWGVIYLDKWWADILWLILMVIGVSLLLLRQLRWGFERLFFPITLSVFGGTTAIGACLLWTLTHGKPFLSHHLLIPVVGLLLSHLLVSVRQGMQAYLGSLRHTTKHRQYLLSCGATHLESVMPSARRALRAALLPSLQNMISPAVISMPLLFCGLLMCGTSPLMAVAVVWLLFPACLSVTVLTLVLAFWLSDRWLFDKQDNLLATSK